MLVLELVGCMKLLYVHLATARAAIELKYFRSITCPRAVCLLDSRFIRHVSATKPRGIEASRIITFKVCKFSHRTTY